MNKALGRAAEKAARTRALLSALELITSDIDVEACNLEKADNAANILYLTQEIVAGMESDLDELAGYIYILEKRTKI